MPSGTGARTAFDCNDRRVRISIGTSGWSYGHWDGVLYPPGTPPRQRLEHSVGRFDTVELNSSFYRWPMSASFAAWRRRLPGGFQLSVKAPRGLTHAKRLYSPDAWIERIAAGWHELGNRRAVLLVQLRPDHERDDARLDYFLDRMPSWIRVAVELRHPSWNDDVVFSMMAGHRAAYCVTSGAHLPCVLRTTSDFVYVRLHGPDRQHMYAGTYPDADLHWWADRIREWDGAGKDVFVYFNNDGYGHAVRNAETLRSILQGHS